MKKILACIGLLSLAIPATAMAIDIGNVQLGGQVRLRGYNVQNVWDFDDTADGDNWSVFRHYTSVNLKMDAGDNITGYISLANQNWGEGDPSEADGRSAKIFVDNSYIDVKSMWGAPISLRLGRQNLMYGSGFVLFDGQSHMGSTSIYFDGIKATLNLNENMWIDGLYFKDQENTRSNAVDDDITMGGLYFTAQKNALGKQEVYLLQRDDQNLKKNIYMLGGRWSDKLDFGLDYSAEIAIQSGDATATVDQKALGYKLDVGYTFAVDMKPRVFAGFVSMSGDDASTADENERWDVFYGGWPQFGDLLAWVYLNVENPNTPGPDNAITNYDPTYNDHSSTGGEAVFSNLQMLTIGASSNFGEAVSLKISGSILTADEVVAGANDDIGRYLQLSAGYKYSKALSFSVYAAMLDPGDAFAGEDAASEVFLESSLRF